MAKTRWKKRRWRKSLNKPVVLHPEFAPPRMRPVEGVKKNPGNRQRGAESFTRPFGPRKPPGTNAGHKTKRADEVAWDIYRCQNMRDVAILSVNKYHVPRKIVGAILKMDYRNAIKCMMLSEKCRIFKKYWSEAPQVSKVRGARLSRRIGGLTQMPAVLDTGHRDGED